MEISFHTARVLQGNPDMGAVGECGESCGDEEERTSYRKHTPLAYVAWVGRKVRESPRSIRKLVEELKRECKSREVEGKPELEALCWSKKGKERIERIPKSDDTIEYYVKRALYALAAAGFVRERWDVDENERVWEVVKDWQEFKTEEEHRLRLMHSCLLFCEALNLEHVLPELDVKHCLTACDPRRVCSSRLNLEYEPLLEHLRTGHPEVYRKYLGWKGAREKAWHCEMEFRKAIEEIASARGFAVKDYAEIREGERAITLLSTNS